MVKISYERRVYESRDNKSLSWDRYISNFDGKQNSCNKGLNYEYNHLQDKSTASLKIRKTRT